MHRIAGAAVAWLCCAQAWAQNPPQTLNSDLVVTGAGSFTTLSTTGNAAVGGTLTAISLPTNPMTLGSPPATLNGVADDSAGVQAARNTITSNGRIYVPAGTINLPTPPTRTTGSFAIWDLTAQPTGGFNSFLSGMGSDVVHAINGGEWWYQRATSATANQGTSPILRVDRQTTHSGGTGWALVQINDTWNATSAPGGQMTSFNVNTTLNATSGASPAVGIFQNMVRAAGSATPGYGANFKIVDNNGTSANIAFIGAEWDIVGNDTWPNNQAGLIDMVLNKAIPGGTTFQANFGVRVGNHVSDLTQGGFFVPFLVGNTNVYTASFGGAPTVATGAVMFDASHATFTDTPGVALRLGSNNAIDLSSGVANVTIRYDSTALRTKIAVGGVDKFSVDASGNVRAAGTVTGSTAP